MFQNKNDPQKSLIWPVSRIGVDAGEILGGEDQEQIFGQEQKNPRKEKHKRKVFTNFENGKELTRINLAFPSL